MFATRTKSADRRRNLSAVPASSDEWLVLAYQRQVGKEPGRLPEDHPDAWQWEYRGTKAERDSLRREMGLDVVDEPAPVIEGQEELF